jgi:hypothetical protein
MTSRGKRSLFAKGTQRVSTESKATSTLASGIITAEVDAGFSQKSTSANLKAADYKGVAIPHNMSYSSSQKES